MAKTIQSNPGGKPTASYGANIWKIYLFNFLTSLHFIGGVLIPFFTDWGQITFFQIMILQSWFIFWTFLLEIPTGAFADSFGRKNSMAIAVAVNIIGILIYTSKPDFSIFLLGEFFWALSAAFSSGAYDALIYDSLKEIGEEKQSKKFFGRFESFSLAGLMIGAPIGSVIAVVLGLRWTMLLMVIPIAAAFLVVLTVQEPKSKMKGESWRYLQMLVGGTKYFYSHKILKILAMDGMVIAILVWFLIWTYQLLLKQLNVPLIYFGAIHAFIALSQIAAMNNFGRLEKIFGSKSKYLFFSALIPGLGFIFLGVNTAVIPAIAAMVIISGFGLTRFTLISNYMQKHIDSLNRATVLSAVSMLRRLGEAVAYLVVGLMVEWSLNYALIIIGMAMVIFALIPKVQESYLID